MAKGIVANCFETGPYKSVEWAKSLRVVGGVGSLWLPSGCILVNLA